MAAVGTGPSSSEAGSPTRRKWDPNRYKRAFSSLPAPWVCGGGCLPASWAAAFSGSLEVDFLVPLNPKGTGGVRRVDPSESLGEQVCPQLPEGLSKQNIAFVKGFLQGRPAAPGDVDLPALLPAFGCLLLFLVKV